MTLRFPYLCVLALSIAVPRAGAAIRVSPQGVNVDTHGATTVLLTFGRLEGYVPGEALWCGDLVTAAPDVGARCDPSTIYGVPPARYDRAQRSGTDAYTDVMSVPPAVSRRAYQASVRGHAATFFYVRRFLSPARGPDQYVAVTLRLSGGGARVPLSLVDVQLVSTVASPIVQVVAGETVPPFSAQIQYTGTGRLRGRWEIVLPGQDPPAAEDLLTEATLPVERRGSQRRYAEIDRFDVFLPPGGRFVLDGPDAGRLPSIVTGQYLVLLRVEASDDREGDTDLAAIGAGQAIVHSGGVAGFPMPVLRYVVGAGGGELSPASPVTIDGVSPPNGASAPPGRPLEFRWTPMPRVAIYRVEIEAGRQHIHDAYVRGVTGAYRVPPFVKDKAASRDVRWRVTALDASGRVIGRSLWRDIALAF